MKAKNKAPRTKAQLEKENRRLKKQVIKLEKELKRRKERSVGWIGLGKPFDLKTLE